jgi:outer membrane biosynthesis protein TonB
VAFQANSPSGSSGNSKYYEKLVGLLVPTIPVAPPPPVPEEPPPPAPVPEEVPPPPLPVPAEAPPPRPVPEEVPLPPPPVPEAHPSQPEEEVTQPPARRRARAGSVGSRVRTVRFELAPTVQEWTENPESVAPERVSAPADAGDNQLEERTSAARIKPLYWTEVTRRRWALSLGWRGGLHRSSWRGRGGAARVGCGALGRGRWI